MGGGVGATELGVMAGAIVTGVVVERVEALSVSSSIGTSYNGRHMQVDPRTKVRMGEHDTESGWATDLLECESSLRMSSYNYTFLWDADIWPRAVQPSGLSSSVDRNAGILTIDGPEYMAH